MPRRKEPEGTLVTLVTYNVHACRGSDGRTDPRRIADVILRTGAGIVALQEVDAGYWEPSTTRQFHELEEALGMPGVFGPTLTRERERFGNAVFTSLPVEKVRHVDLSMPGRQPRAALDVILRVDGSPLRVVNTHLGLQRWERQRQVARLVKALNEGPDVPMVLLGDFNEWRFPAWPLRPLDRILPARFGPRTFSSAFPALRLDRVWVRPKAAVRSVRSVRDAQTPRASDHLPVVVVLSH